MADLNDLTAAQALDLLEASKVTSEELTKACLARIDAREKVVGAWTFLDPDHAIEQARAADLRRARRQPTGPLHGLPIGLKDIFDTDDMPTENGADCHKGRQPAADSWVAARLRAQGAVLLGKTVTTEFATYRPGKTRNPHDPKRTPGGSSSGSAAAVGDRMVPLAIGSQTNGSVIRPAAFCGVVGFKPSHGLIPRTGAFMISRFLDHVGTFGRTVEDIALLAEALAGFDEADPDTRSRPSPALRRVAMEAPPVEPRFAYVKTPWWDQASADTHRAFAALTKALGARVVEVPLAAEFADALDHHRAIMLSDLADNLRREWAHQRDALSPRLRDMIGDGLKTTVVRRREAERWAALYRATLHQVLDEFDAILTPAAVGEAPADGTTGAPTFCTLWSLTGLPAVTLPVLEGDSGLPLGAQLVGRYGDDGRLLRTAQWLAGFVARGAKTPPTKAGKRRRT